MVDSWILEHYYTTQHNHVSNIGCLTLTKHCLAKTITLASKSAHASIKQTTKLR